MKEYTLTPFQQQKNIQVTVPGSKSITNRALLLAALAKGTTTLQGVLFSDDSRVFMEALKSLGYTLSIQEEENPALSGVGICRKCRDSRQISDSHAGSVRGTV